MNIRERQNGSAMVESILIVGVLTIFMVGVPMIGSMINLKQTSIQASRYSAWEKTVNVDKVHEGALIQERFFRDASAPISSSSNAGVAANHLWGELPTQANTAGAGNGTAPGGQGDLSVSQMSRITIGNGSTRVNSAEDRANSGTAYKGVAKVVTTLGGVLSREGWGDDNAISNGLVKSTVSTQIDSNEFFTSGLSMEESTSIFIDGWSAADDAVIRARVHGFVPTNTLETIGDYVSLLRYIPLLSDLKNLKGALGCVKNNIVPGEKYAPDGTNGLTIYDPSAGDNC